LAALGEAARELRRLLRRDGLREDLVARAFSLVREVSHQAVGMRHFDSQLRGGWVMLNGMIAEMNTGEGKTLTATLPACTMALAGVPVHGVTGNDSLGGRDAGCPGPVVPGTDSLGARAAEFPGPLYKALGISVGTVVDGQEPPVRQAAY